MKFLFPIRALLAALYGAVVRVRVGLYARGWLRSQRLPAPVISVGNLTVGGTGKTPCVAWLANWLQREGRQVAILSRGYGRMSKGRVLVSDGARIFCDAASAGDEPYLLARNCAGVQVVVDAQRYEAGQWLAQRQRVDVFVLDDGYQHLRVRRDVNLVLLDATDELAQARLVPAGRLREPLRALQRADAVIVTRADTLHERTAFVARLRQFLRAQVPIFFARHALTSLRRVTSTTDVPTPTLPLAALAGQQVAAFAGIARPAQFFAALPAACQVAVVWQKEFSDHHRYTETDWHDLQRHAQAASAQALVCTEKDAVKLAAFPLTGRLPCYAAVLAFVCEEEAALQQWLREQLRIGEGD